MPLAEWRRYTFADRPAEVYWVLNLFEVYRVEVCINTELGTWRAGYNRRPSPASSVPHYFRLDHELDAATEEEAKEEALRWVRAEEARLLAVLDNLDEVRGTVTEPPEEGRKTAWDRILADDDG